MDKARDRRETIGSRKKFSKGEGGAKGPVRLLKARKFTYQKGKIESNKQNKKGGQLK